jgi:hypothetical protein
VIILAVYSSAFPKKLGKAYLNDVKTEFEKFVQNMSGSSTDVYSYIETVQRSYTMLKFGQLKRQDHQEDRLKLPEYPL